MKHREHMVEQHILEYESRLKHIDEMLDRAHQAAGEAAGEHQELGTLAGDRDKLASQLSDLKHKSVEDIQHDEISLAGPMGVWDALAGQLEKLIEKLEK